MNKLLKLNIFLLLAVSVIACSKLDSGSGIDGGDLSFHIPVIDVTKSFSEVTTASLRADANGFSAAAFISGTTTKLFQDSFIFNSSSKLFESVAGHYFGGNTLDFYSVYPSVDINYGYLSEGKLDERVVMLDDVSLAEDGSSDIIVSMNKNATQANYSDSVVPLSFHHALTAIKFRAVAPDHPHDETCWITNLQIVYPIFHGNYVFGNSPSTGYWMYNTSFESFINSPYYTFDPQMYLIVPSEGLLLMDYHSAFPGPILLNITYEFRRGSNLIKTFTITNQYLPNDEQGVKKTFELQLGYDIDRVIKYNTWVCNWDYTYYSKEIEGF